jgi:hypothetical protein
MFGNRKTGILCLFLQLVQCKPIIPKSKKKGKKKKKKHADQRARILNKLISSLNAYRKQVWH